MASIQGIYIALFGRPADPIGLKYFNSITNNGQNLASIGNLAGQPEYLNRFEGMNNAQIVTSIYQQLFGRNPDLAGLQFFTQQLNSGAQTINTIAINILDGAQNEDRALVDAKIAAADLFTAAVAADPDALAAYQGPAGIAFGQAFLAQIDEPTDILTNEQVQAQVAAFGDGVSSPGQTFTLTTDIDALVGTAGNDTFIAGVTTGGLLGGETLGIGDSIDGGAGTDRLNLFGDANVAAFDDATISNIEQVYAQVQTSGVELDVSGNADVQQAWVSNGNISDVDNGDVTVTLNTTQVGGITGTVKGDDDAGDTANVNFNFKNTAAANNAATIALNAAVISSADASVTTNGIENLTVLATGKNSIGDLDDGSLETLTLQGEGSVSFEHNGNNLESIDATGLAGGFTGDISGIGAEDIVVKGGAGDDELTVDYGDLTKADSIDLGAGSNTLAFDTDATFNTALLASKLAGVANVETLKVVGGNDLTVDGEFVSQNSFALKGDGSDITATDIDDDATVTFLEGDHDTSNVGLVLGASTLNVELVGSKSDTSYVDQLNATGTKVVNIDSTDLPETGGGNGIGLTAADNQTVNLTGTGDLGATFVAASGVTGFTINGADFGGDLDLIGTNAADSITGGAGDDVLAGEAHVNVAARAQVSTIDFVADYDQGDVITITFNTVNYTYTVPGAQGALVSSDVIFNNLANFTNGGTNLATALAAAGVMSVYDSVTDTVTLTGPAAGTAFTVASTIDNSADTYDVSARQVIDTAIDFTVATGDSYSLTAGGTTYNIEVGADLADAATWIYTGGATTYDAFLSAITGAGSAQGASLTVDATTGDLTITAAPTAASIVNPVVLASATDTSAAVTHGTSLSNQPATGAPADQANPVVATPVTGVIAGSTIDVVAKNADVFTGGAGEDTFIVASASGNVASDADVITDFTTGEDSIVFNFNGFSDDRGAAGSATNYAEGTSAVASFAAAVTAANGQLDGTVIYSAQQVGEDTFVFYDGNADGTIDGNDYVVKLTGVALDGVEFTDIATI